MLAAVDGGEPVSMIGLAGDLGFTLWGIFVVWWTRPLGGIDVGTRTRELELELFPPEPSPSPSVGRRSYYSKNPIGAVADAYSQAVRAATGRPDPPPPRPTIVTRKRGWKK